MNKIAVKPLVWSPISKSNSDIPYDHTFAMTAFGRILITWKGWKDNDWPTIDECPGHDYLNVSAYSSVESAKDAAFAMYASRVFECLTRNNDE